MPKIFHLSFHEESEGQGKIYSSGEKYLDGQQRDSIAFVYF
jgi:hypothetical protein